MCEKKKTELVVRRNPSSVTQEDVLEFESEYDRFHFCRKGSKGGKVENTSNSIASVSGAHCVQFQIAGDVVDVGGVVGGCVWRLSLAEGWKWRRVGEGSNLL